MGYAHYFTGAVATPEVIEDARKIVATTEVVLAGPMGDGKVQIESGMIALNGSEALGEDYESFVIDDDQHSLAFCKTNYRPYDEVVTAILVSVVVRGAGSVTSNGTFEEWADGIALFEKAVRPLTEAEKVTLSKILG